MQIEKLASKIAQRDKKAFEDLYSETSRIVYSVCLGIVHNRSIAQELTQDVFVAVWESINGYGGKGFKTWIITIARNKSLNYLRSAKREISVDFSQYDNLGDGYTIDEREETRSTLDSALRILQEDERQIVLMRNAGMKAKEIADVLGLPRGTVSWKYSTALERMKQFLEREQ
ncbi:MAG: RNA polymerase sigma factor [Clostridia bacterium]|nr:RNA polymerase sigma factor [Clostridia bacterium]